jgi:Mrp family chromosome partitioning ATPase
VSTVYDHVVIDPPPLLNVGDTLEIVRHSDAVVLCVRTDQTTRDQTRAALAALGRLPHRPTGVVVTGTTPSSAEDYGYYAYAYAS